MVRHARVIRASFHGPATEGALCCAVLTADLPASYGPVDPPYPFPRREGIMARAAGGVCTPASRSPAAGSIGGEVAVAGAGSGLLLCRAVSA
jgi:hypothetical protein